MTTLELGVPRAGDFEVTRRLLVALVVTALLLAIGATLSLMLSGTGFFSPHVVWDAIAGRGNPEVEAAVRDLRIPRTILAIIVGANLAVAGALVQGVTRNPIVEPSIIGINSGAALAVALVTFLGGASIGRGPLSLTPFVAFLGAAAAAAIVYALVSGIDTTPGRIALAGVTVALLANALVTGTVMVKDAAVYLLMHFLVGGLDNTSWASVQTILPYAVLGLAAALLMARSLTILELGDDVARALGLQVARVRVLAIAFIVVLAGSTVAVAGPIAMVGLLVPHISRWLVGRDFRRVLPLAMLGGALLVVVADIVARLLAPPTETPVGVLTAALGTPYFIFLARRGRGAV